VQNFDRSRDARRKTSGAQIPGSRSGFGIWVTKKILPVCIVWIELAPDVIPVIVSLRAMFDAIHAFKFLDVFVPVPCRSCKGVGIVPPSWEQCPPLVVVKGAVSRGEPELPRTLARVHTPAMTPKNAALLALIGTILMTVLLVWSFVFILINVLRDLVPAVTLLSSFIYAIGSLTVAVFFYTFHRAQ
jgi:hypothetical protein